MLSNEEHLALITAANNAHGSGPARLLRPLAHKKELAVVTGRLSGPVPVRPGSAVIVHPWQQSPYYGMVGRVYGPRAHICFRPTGTRRVITLGEIVASSTRPVQARGHNGFLALPTLDDTLPDTRSSFPYPAPPFEPNRAPLLDLSIEAIEHAEYAAAGVLGDSAVSEYERNLEQDRQRHLAKPGTALHRSATSNTECSPFGTARDYAAVLAERHLPATGRLRSGVMLCRSYQGNWFTASCNTEKPPLRGWFTIAGMLSAYRHRRIASFPHLRDARWERVTTP